MPLVVVAHPGHINSLEVLPPTDDRVVVGMNLEQQPLGDLVERPPRVVLAHRQLLQHHELESFAQLVAKVRERAQSEMFFQMDIKPPFADTPDNWESVLESTFSGVYNGDDTS